MTVTTDVVLGVLGVAGAPFSVLLPRSTDFADLFDILKLRYPRSIDLMVVSTCMLTPYHPLLTAC